MDAKLYLKELKRLTNSCNMNCDDCRLYDEIECECQEGDEMWVDIVEQWAKDCPPETVLDVFKKVFPNYKLYHESLYPLPCPSDLDKRYEPKCNGQAYAMPTPCKECWNQSAIAEPRKEPQKELLISVDECHNCKYTCKSPDEWPCKICSNNYTNEFRIREVD